jgi:hypothetical protein
LKVVCCRVALLHSCDRNQQAQVYCCGGSHGVKDRECHCLL